MKAERKIKRARQEGYAEGYQAGIIQALNNFVGITMTVLKRDYNWTDEELEEFSNKLMNKPKTEKDPDQISMFDETETTQEEGKSNDQES